MQHCRNLSYDSVALNSKVKAFCCLTQQWCISIKLSYNSVALKSTPNSTCSLTLNSCIFISSPSESVFYHKVFPNHTSRLGDNTSTMMVKDKSQYIEQMINNKDTFLYNFSVFCTCIFFLFTNQLNTFDLNSTHALISANWVLVLRHKKISYLEHMVLVGISLKLCTFYSAVQFFNLKFLFYTFHLLRLIMYYM